MFRFDCEEVEIYMGKMKLKVARSLSGNIGLNRKALEMKKSWDEVSNMLKSDNKKKK